MPSIFNKTSDLRRLPKGNSLKQRIIGIDVARALAVVGMIIVNFKVVLGNSGSTWVEAFAGIFDGKAAATFVVLAGVGLALMSNSALRDRDGQKLRTVRIRIAKRALFLFIVGLSYITIWPADILHYYGVYMLVILLLLTSSERVILLSALALILFYPLLLGFYDYETGWNLETLEYLDFWTLNGFFRNLFINGFHPIIPWTSFMLVGFWFGKQPLSNDRFINMAFWISSSAFVVIQVLSHFAISFLPGGNSEMAEEWSVILGTDPMPPVPIYMLNGMAISISVISGCIIIGKRFPANSLVVALNRTGQLALTFYVAHVILGMGMIEAIDPERLGAYPIEFSVVYALLFSILCVVFAQYWLKKRTNGPLEWMMKKIIA